MKIRALRFAAFLALFARCLVPTALAQVTAQDITGLVVGPNGASVLDGQLSFDLSQSGVVPGVWSIVPVQALCATDRFGQVRGLRNPLVAPIATPNTSSGTIAAGTWYVKITYYQGDGMTIETDSSPAATVVLGSTGKIIFTPPVIQPETAVGYKIYMSDTLGEEGFQATVVGFVEHTLEAYDALGDDDPEDNNTVCSLFFNDSIIPPYTFYKVTLTNAAGGVYPGFPQNWYLTGLGLDLSNNYPVASVTNQVRFPTPILSNPPSNAQQSVASPVTLNGYTMTAGSLVLPNDSSPASCLASQAVLYSDSSSRLTICDNAVSKTAVRALGAKGVDVVSGSCSSGDCTLGNGNFFVITGTTTVDGFATTGWWPGAIVVIQTSGSITFNNNGTVAAGYAAMKLVGGANVSMTADDNIQLMYTGTYWDQIAPTLVK